jgi:Holliday junction resolvase-like predicted endonuclease
VITTDIGKKAEALVADYFNGWGFKIIDRNYRTKVCEIDIVAKKGQVVYFIEVKYRSRDGQGAGLDYITPKKLRRLHFAAEVWIQRHDWGGDYRLMAAAVATNGRQYQIENLVELD